MALCAITVPYLVVLSRNEFWYSQPGSNKLLLWYIGMCCRQFWKCFVPFEQGCKAAGLFCYLLNIVAQLQSFWVCVKCIFDYENIQKKEESAEVENTKN